MAIFVQQILRFITILVIFVNINQQYVKLLQIRRYLSESDEWLKISFIYYKTCDTTDLITFLFHTEKNT